MSDLAEFRASLDGELFSPDSPGYEAIRRPANPVYREVRPRLVVLCRSVSDVVGATAYATATGDRVAPCGGGHCFAGRSSAHGSCSPTAASWSATTTANRTCSGLCAARAAASSVWSRHCGSTPSPSR